MDRPTDYIPAIALALSLAIPPCAAQVAPPPATPGTGSTPWNSSTIPQPPRPASADGALSLRIYGNLDQNRLPPHQPGGPRHDDRAYAVDVSAVMTRCADGSLVITALVIGGQLTPLENRCPVERARNPEGPAPACDANRWNCTTTGSRPAN
jgi:hypothetical protein